MESLSGFPFPGTSQATVAVAAPGSGSGFWAGASSAAFGPDGQIVIAYRLRTPDRRGADIVVATSEDGRHLDTVDVLEKERFGADSLERPALVGLDGGWRLYVSCATPNTKHWRIDAVDALRPDEFHTSTSRTVFAGSRGVGLKDPVVRRRGTRWHAWLCCHPLDQPGEEDRMSTAYATSDDGLEWRWFGDVLSGRPGFWDARGARVTSVLPDGRASYDGRANKAENFSEQTGLAVPSGAAGRLRAIGDAPISNVRYLDLVPVPSGGYLAYFERSRADGSHDLCVQVCPG
jgi:hypothetical protein